jgi:hypothetical protein
MNSQVSNIIADLKELQQVLEQSGKNEGLSAIELDIIKNRLQQIYEKLIHLPLSELKPLTIPVNKTDQENEKTGLLTQDDKSALKSDDLMQIEEQIKTENANDYKEKKDTRELKPKTGPRFKQNVVESKEILAEKYHKDQKYINEILAQSYHKQDISSQMQSKPIKDIEASIGVNEKFLFVHELFSNNEETYLKTIRSLNDSSNFNEAFNYIHTNFNWDLKGEAAQILLDLVRRRFIVEEE